MIFVFSYSKITLVNVNQNSFQATGLAFRLIDLRKMLLNVPKLLNFEYKTLPKSGIFQLTVYILFETESVKYFSRVL